MLTPAIIRELPKRRARPEDAVQSAVVQHLKLRARPGVVFHSVPNEGKRSGREADRLKKMGLTPGVNDLVILLPPDGRYAGLELKDRKNGRHTEEQKCFGDAVIAAGGLYAVAWDIDEALDILTEWGVFR